MFYKQWMMLSEVEKTQAWQYMAREGKRDLLADCIRNTPESEWYEGFALFVSKADGYRHLMEFYMLANKLIDFGAEHLRSKALVERLRDTTEGDGSSLFQIDNRYTADVTWLWVLMFPERFGPVFEIRKACRSAELKRLLADEPMGVAA